MKKIIFPQYIHKRTSESPNEISWEAKRKELLLETPGELVADAPFLYLDRRLVSQSLTRVRLFEMILEVQGAIIECGVHRGNSLMLYYHLSTILEPVAFTRKIIGFDTFEGFPSISSKDPSGVFVGGMKDTDLNHINKWVSLQDLNRSISHIPKIQLVKGDACKAIPEFVENNPHLLVALLYLDFDLYEPTKVALEYLLPLIPKGGVVAFDELNQAKWQGETIAMKEMITISNIRLRKFHFEPHVSCFVRE